MFGTLRLALALAVLLSHTGVGLGPFEIGNAAVVVFFVISGYAITGLVSTRFGAGRRLVPFCRERFVRLAPQYYLWLGFAALVYLGLGWGRLDLAGFVPYGLLAYLTVVPLGLQGYTGTVDTWLVSQASTLGVEITFYLAALRLAGSRRGSLACGLACLAIFAATDAGALPPGLYTYYTSPGPLPAFVLGSFLYRRDWSALAALGGPFLCVLAATPAVPFNAEFLLGTLVGVPCVAGLARVRPRAWDSRLGDASYGCYLGHMTFNTCILHLAGAESFTPALRALAVLAGAAGGYAGYLLVERPTLGYRRRIAATGALPSGARSA